MTTFYSQLRTPKLKMIIQQEFIARPEDKVKYYTNTTQYHTIPCNAESASSPAASTAQNIVGKPTEHCQATTAYPGN